MRLATGQLRFSLKLKIVALALAAFSGSAGAAQFSFTGVFANDNDVQLFNFALSSSATITLQTFGYGGGTNAALQTILPGGFEPVLQVYASPSGIAQGGPLLPGNDNPPCTPRNPDPNRLDSCLDVYGQLSLGAGDYVLALTQHANVSLGDLSDGFFYVDVVNDPNFNNSFHGDSGLPGDGHWALDILGVDSASPVGAVPEPSTAALTAIAVLLAGFGARRIHPRTGSRSAR
jgi:hypothetical protein